MNRNTVTIGIVVVIILILAGVYFYFSSSSPRMEGPNVAMESATTSAATGMGTSTSAPGAESETDGTSGADGSSSEPAHLTVTLKESGFFPQTLTVTKGTIVTFVNNSSGQMWVASDPHPTHNGYDGTTRDEHCASGYTGPAPFDECAVKDTFTFTFDKVGSWGYHNHLDHDQTGTIVVK